MSGLATQGAFAVIVPAFEAQEGFPVRIDWLPTAVVVERLAAGARCDVLVIGRGAVDRLADAGAIDSSSRIEVAESRVGLAVARGAPHPDVSTPEALKATLLAARSVAFSKTGASGIHFVSVLERLGIAEAIRERATILPDGLTAQTLVSGEADLAVQQISELLVVPGIEIVGPLPEALQQVLSLSAATMRTSANDDIAARFLAFLKSPAAVNAYRASGIDPVA